MLLDQTSLLIAIGLASTALMLTLLMSWMGSRNDRYLLSWGVGLAFTIPGLIAFGLFEHYVAALQFASFAFFHTGFAMIYVGAVQFRTGRTPVKTAAILWAISVATTALGYAAGFSGIGTAFGNFGCALFFILAGREYWVGRAESPLTLMVKAVLCGLIAITFVLCGFVLLSEGQFVLTARPWNWAEDLNSVSLIVALAGMGALALTLNQMRTAQLHRQQAMTDSLTGLLNRRAVFDLVSNETLPAGTAVVMFDLDSFKAINDKFGHAVGDEVLGRFSAIIRENLRPTDKAARLGGEEFCLVLDNVNAGAACAVAERIRAALQRTPLLSAEFGTPTVSAGVAISTAADQSFDDLLRQADTALYKAKSAGRNRVQGPPRRLVA